MRQEVPCVEFQKRQQVLLEHPVLTHAGVAPGAREALSLKERRSRPCEIWKPDLVREKRQMGAGG